MTRDEFLREVYRVLKPEGRVALSDYFVSDEGHRLLLEHLHRFHPDWPEEGWPEENCLPNLDAYRENLIDIGFEYVRVEDSTEFVQTPFRTFRIRKAEMEEDHEALKVLMSEKPIGTHCMVYAIKY